MVFDGGISLVLIVGSSVLSIFNTSFNLYNWLSGPSTTNVPNIDEQNKKHKYTVYCDYTSELYKKIIIDINKKIDENLLVSNIHNDTDSSSDDETHTLTDAQAYNRRTKIDMNELDIISFNSRIPPRTNESSIKRYRVDYYKIPSNGFTYNNIKITPNYINGSRQIVSFGFSSDDKTCLDTYINKFVGASEQFAVDN